jgi:hypothetical protein
MDVALVGAVFPGVSNAGETIVLTPYCWIA